MTSTVSTLFPKLCLLLLTEGIVPLVCFRASNRKYNFLHNTENIIIDSFMNKSCMAGEQHKMNDSLPCGLKGAQET
jgi:hypothetical protein